MRRLLVFLTAIGALGLTASDTAARTLTVSKGLTQQTCGGQTLPKCTFCNSLKCYWVKSCKGKTCKVLVVESRGPRTTKSRFDSVPSAGLLEGSGGGFSFNSPSATGTPIGPTSPSRGTH